MGKKENKAHYAILGILSEGPASGYDIKTMMKLSTDFFWAESDSSIYPALKALSEEGCVEASIDSTNPNKPKKSYSITKLGLKKLHDWLEKSPDKTKVRNDFLLKIFFGWNVSPEVSELHLKEEALKSEKTSLLLEKLYKERKSKKSTKKNTFQLLTLRNGILINEAKIKWCQEALLALKKMKRTKNN